MTRTDRFLVPAAGVLVLAGLAAALAAPPDRLQGNLQRLMYVHVPAAWLAYLSFGLTLAASVAWLRRRHERWDRLAASAAEVGVFFTALTIALGAIWGKPVWGVWWTWDPRLVSTAVLLFVYLGYLALRRATVDPVQRARRSAVFGIVASVQIPVVHLSVLWWRSLHQPPTVLRPGDPTIDHVMLAALLLNVVAFTAVFAVALRLRMRLARQDAELAAATTALGRPLAGSAVTVPALTAAAVTAPAVKKTIGDRT
ncbi:cytochrome C biogenesis protein [Actinotalea ferrariae CF5-4]|uniref:Heme exporter protein C n=1 Tax=Actinotalea ferrariae CF5-4 TaxID=948458 RepID=A0A021VTN6_9CELL|nr:cytochrome c biogenesis protein CcsA [Actinotalea ferrariae]EYR64493.1 cytochrome C biogenesis protein [Actinotalea ferrariae CF5-4]